MKEVNLLYLDQEDIIGLDAPWGEMIDVIEKVFIEHNEDRIELPPKPGVHPGEGSFIHAMPCYLPKLNISGMKWISGFPSNNTINLPQITGLLILNDVNTGLPLTIMDARWITAVRTAIVSAITAKYCAIKGSKILGIIGTGVQGIFHTIALQKVLPTIEKVKIFDLYPSSMDNYKNTINEMVDIEVQMESVNKDVVVGSDVVITATQRLEKPIIDYAWLKSGVLGIGLESGRAWGETITQMDRFITDDWKQTESFMLTGAYPKSIEDKYQELGDIINKKVTGRNNEEEMIMAGNLGIAAVDMVLADYLYKLALEKKVGKSLSLMKSDNLFS